MGREGLSIRKGGNPSCAIHGGQGGEAPLPDHLTQLGVAGYTYLPIYVKIPLDQYSTTGTHGGHT